MINKIRLHTLTSLACVQGSTQEDNEDDCEDQHHQEDLEHEPAVGGDVLEVLEQFSVCCLNIQLCLIYIGVDPGDTMTTP